MKEENISNILAEYNKYLSHIRNFSSKTMVIQLQL